MPPPPCTPKGWVGLLYFGCATIILALDVRQSFFLLVNFFSVLLNNWFNKRSYSKKLEKYWSSEYKLPLQLVIIGV